MKKMLLVFALLGLAANSYGGEIRVNGDPGLLEVRAAGAHSVRVTLKPRSMGAEMPQTPAVAERDYPAPAISLTSIDRSVKKRVGELNVEVRPNPLTVIVTGRRGERIQQISFGDDGRLAFDMGAGPVVGMGEGGSRPPRGADWRTLPVEYDRRGIFDRMLPRWQSDAYGSRNPVSMLISPAAWAIYLPTPWTEVDLTGTDKGYFVPWKPNAGSGAQQDVDNQQESGMKGIPPLSSYVPGLYDFFVFDARDSKALMTDYAVITGRAAMPPKWALGYMQSHRTLEDEAQLHGIVETFREKQIPVDAMIYLGTGFCPQGWNTRQPSYTFDPDFIANPRSFLSRMHGNDVKVVLHVVPFGRRELPTLHGTIPAKPGETMDPSHIQNYWKFHEPLIADGVDAFWPDEGDWFDLFERIKRHQMYYQGSLYTTPDKRPWSLHRNGYPGIAQWGGWVWSGDTDASWKTLEAQIAVGLNYSVSISPFWGSDIGGFYSNPELTGELYARWVQFAAFTPSFRGHGRTWMLRLPWGWGKSFLGPLEVSNPPLERELFNDAIEPVVKHFIELRYRLLPYTYTLAWEARETGMPLMRPLWMHYPNDQNAKSIGNEYLWGENMLVAPVFEKGATNRRVYLPAGQWYDWWTGEAVQGGGNIEREVDLEMIPIYVKAGTILPIDPVRQYAEQRVSEPTVLRVYPGANGAFTLYDDDGTSQGYLAGDNRIIDMKWDQARRELTLSPAAGSGAWGPARRFTVELATGTGAGRTVTYDGSKVTVKL